MIRSVEPEILDTLAEDDPAALRNRKDITHFNILMGNFRWFCQNLLKHLLAKDEILEIGAGGGELGSYLANRLSCGFPLKMDGLDLWSRPEKWPHSWNWHQADLTDFDNYSPYSVITASMILHQFKESALRRLGEKIRHNARLIIASETARSRTSLFLFKIGKSILRYNRVTQHDAPASIRAGFRGDELPHMLGLPPDQWAWTCRTGLRGQYRMIAIRKEKIANPAV